MNSSVLSKILAVIMIHQVSAQAWTQVPITTWWQGKEISGRIHDDIWVTRPDGVVFHWENNAWGSKPGLALQISGSFESNRSWCVGANNQAYRFDGTNWNALPSSDPLRQVSAKSYELAIAVTNSGSLIKYENGIWSGLVYQWLTTPTPKKMCSIGRDDTVWCVDTNRNLWRWSCEDYAFKQMSGVADYVDVYDSTRVAVTNSQTGEVFIFMIGNKKWTNERKQLAGSCRQATISQDHIYCTAFDNSMWWAPYPIDSY